MPSKDWVKCEGEKGIYKRKKKDEPNKYDDPHSQLLTALKVTPICLARAFGSIPSFSRKNLMRLQIMAGRAFSSVFPLFKSTTMLHGTVGVSILRRAI